MNEYETEQRVLEHCETEFGLDECKHNYVFTGKYGIHTDTYRCKKCGRIIQYHWGGEINKLHN
jgi:hypothetical protein